MAPVLKVIQYNVLSQRCAKTDERGFPHVDPAFLDEKVRAVKIAADILAVDADVLCLQEFDDTIDGRESELKRLLSPTFEFHPSDHTGTHQPCIALLRDGVWKWELRSHDFIHPRVTQRVVLIMLEHTQTAQHVVISTTHLKSGAEHSALRYKQAVDVLWNIEVFNREDLPVVLAGDLNCEPSEATYSLVKESGLRSVYDAEEHDPQHYTTRKMRAQEKCVCEDYMFYTPDSLEVVAKRQLPPKDTIAYPYLPNAQHGSDHLMLWAEFQLKQ
jgi:endonuclease/exonuclease/phosphatase family metal-dependent hydrolase